MKRIDDAAKKLSLLEEKDNEYKSYRMAKIKQQKEIDIPPPVLKFRFKS